MEKFMLAVIVTAIVAVTGMAMVNADGPGSVREIVVAEQPTAMRL